ncbi:MAG: hypothetical protein F6K31_41330, partial [Symploca sp. SIO2G7]|nr:hypothetical protein [Symploca sp. SIO2G7]
WHWWHSQQQQQQQAQAEIVRDGLLQEAFALRRQLEQSDCPGGKSASYLKQVNRFYQSLESLSNQLSPPFVDDSLPLALQFLLKHRGQNDPSIGLDPDTDWSANIVNGNLTLLSIVTELLPLLASDPEPVLKVRLWREADVNNLQITSDISNQQPQASPVKSVEMQYLQEIFHSLMSGTLNINQDDIKLTCQLSWPMVK